MLLTFRTKLKMLMHGDKYTTIRPETPSRKTHWKRHETPENSSWHPRKERVQIRNTWGEKCHIWWLNPRNMSPFCRKVRASSLRYIQRCLGDDLRPADAIADGFDSLPELIEKLSKINSKSINEVMTTTWYIYCWDTHGDIREGWVVNHYVHPCKDTNCPLCEEIKKEEEHVPEMH